MRAMTVAACTVGIAVVPLAAQQHLHERAIPDSATSSALQCHAMGMMGSMMTGGMRSGAMPGENVSMMERSEGMGSGGWMMGAARLSPWYVLSYKEDLGLEDAQVAKIETLTQGPEIAAVIPETRPLYRQLEQAFTATPADTAAIRAALDRLASLHVRGLANYLVTAASLRAILTPEQRAALDRLPPPCSMG